MTLDNTEEYTFNNICSYIPKPVVIYDDSIWLSRIWSLDSLTIVTEKNEAGNYTYYKIKYANILITMILPS